MERSINLTNRRNLKILLTIFTVALSVSGASAQTCRKIAGLGAAAVFFDTSTPQCKAAKEAFDTAIVVVTGTPDYEFNKDKKKSVLDTTQTLWVSDLAKDPKYSAKFNEGLKFSDAVNFLKERIAVNAGDRQFAIDNAFMEVYGHNSVTEDQARWDSQIRTQKAWYAVIVTSEIGRLNSDPARRTSLIDDVYAQTMGRTAAPEELAYWKPRTEHFRLMVAANRAFLYSGNPKANQDLAKTIETAYTAKYGKAPTEPEKKTALKNVADKKLIFQEMMRPEVSLK